MAFEVDKKGNITLVQGDSGTLVVNGLNTDKNYTLYLAVKDKNRNTVGNEIYVSTQYQPSVVFTITGDFTNLLSVERNKQYEIYYYGLKLCSPDDELRDTLIFDGGYIGDFNTITVFPKKVEGGN